MQKINRDAWICKAGHENLPNQYLCFRRSFNLENTASVRLRISANWDFILYCNGTECLRGQFPDYPEHKTYTEIFLTNLKAGRNILAVLVYNPGEDFFSQIKAPAGLWVNLFQDDRLILAADQDWKCRQDPMFHSGAISQSTPNLLGFNFLARLEQRDQWFLEDFDDRSWENAAVIPYEPELSPRKIAPLRIADSCTEGTIVKGGHFSRGEEKDTFARTVRTDFYNWKHRFVQKLPVTLTQWVEFNGFVLILDLGKEMTGLLELEFQTDEATVIDVSHGEHLDDGMVRCWVGDRNFTDRLTAPAGHHSFQMPFRRFGARYLQLNIQTKGTFTLTRAGLREVSASLTDPQAEFSTDSELSGRLHATAVRTMQCCMHDHYEDCPWREQSLYSYDSRNQILFGYYVWGNYAFAAESLRLLGKGCQEDWELNLCAPTHRTIVIPIFSMVWISALLEHYRYSGELTLLREFSAQISGMGENLFSSLDPEKGLLPLPAEKGKWNFYEWIPGLFDCKVQDRKCFHALHNLYACEMFRSISRIMEALDQEEEKEVWAGRYENLKKQITDAFTSPDGSLLLTTLDDGAPVHAHTQYLGMFTGAVPQENLPKIFQTLSENPKINHVSASPLPYMLRTLFEISPEARAWCIRKIDSIFTAMLDEGATTFYETPEGGDDFHYCGSLCHAWSSIHVLYHGAYVLGVTPLEPGFRRFRVRPYTVQFGQAEGEVPTPAGRIRISWKKRPDGSVDLEVAAPEGLVPEIQSFPECPIHSVKTLSL